MSWPFGETAKLGHRDGTHESQHNMTHLNPFFTQFSNKEKGQRAGFWQSFCQFVLAGAGRKDLEQRYQGNSGSERAGPEAFSEDQGLFKSDKLTLEMAWRRRGDGWRKRKKKRPNESRRKTGVVCQQIDCS